MAEVIVKVDVPSKLESRFGAALEKVVNEFVNELEFSVAKEILSKSRLTEKQAKAFSDEVKIDVAKRHCVA